MRRNLSDDAVRRHLHELADTGAPLDSDTAAAISNNPQLRALWRTIVQIREEFPGAIATVAERSTRWRAPEVGAVITRAERVDHHRSPDRRWRRAPRWFAPAAAAAVVAVGGILGMAGVERSVSVHQDTIAAVQDLVETVYADRPSGVPAAVSAASTVVLTGSNEYSGFVDDLMSGVSEVLLRSQSGSGSQEEVQSVVGAPTDAPAPTQTPLNVFATH